MDKKIESLLEKYINKQPERLAIREVYFGHCGNINCNNDDIDDVEYQQEIKKVEEIKSKLIPMLNESQLKQFDKLIELIEIDNLENEVSCYESGFMLGVNLGVESRKFIIG